MELTRHRADIPDVQVTIGRARILVAAFLAALASACASTGGGVPRPFPAPSSKGTTHVSAPPVTYIDGRSLASTALSLRGAPYLNGGGDPRGFDCSGFTQYVFARYGIALPRGVHDQFEAGAAIKRRELAPGDLLFFQTTGPGATHVGVAIDADQFVHAPSSKGVVRVERLSSKYWGSRFLGARRLTHS